MTWLLNQGIGDLDSGLTICAFYPGVVPGTVEEDPDELDNQDLPPLSNGTCKSLPHFFEKIIHEM